MDEGSGELETTQPRVKSGLLRDCAEIYHEILQDYLKKNNLAGLPFEEFLDSVIELERKALPLIEEKEKEKGRKLDEDEYCMLCMLSYVTGVVKKNYEAERLPPRPKLTGTFQERKKKLEEWKKEVEGMEEKQKKAKAESVVLQQTLTQIIERNLGDDLTCKPGISLTLQAVTRTYEAYLDAQQGVVPGIEGYDRFMTGMRGMVTTMILFKEAGWEIEYPPIELDRDHGVDLIVKLPRKDRPSLVLGVDIKARRRRGRSPFYLDYRRGKNGWPDLVKSADSQGNIQQRHKNDFNDFLRINVPPVDYARKYADVVIGVPNQELIKEFKRGLSNKRLRATP